MFKNNLLRNLKDIKLTKIPKRLRVLYSKNRKNKKNKKTKKDETNDIKKTILDDDNDSVLNDFKAVNNFMPTSNMQTKTDFFKSQTQFKFNDDESLIRNDD
jgi:hypothetical protein